MICLNVSDFSALESSEECPAMAVNTNLTLTHSRVSSQWIIKNHWKNFLVKLFLIIKMACKLYE